MEMLDHRIGLVQLSPTKDGVGYQEALVAPINYMAYSMGRKVLLSNTMRPIIHQDV